MDRSGCFRHGAPVSLKFDDYDLAYSAWAGLNSKFIGPFDDPVEVALTGLVGNTAGDMNDDKATN